MRSNAELILFVRNSNLSLSEALREVDMLRKRFNFEISVFFPEPSIFFFEYKEVLEKTGVQINRIGIADEVNYLADLLEFCKRFDKNKVVVKEFSIEESKFQLNLIRDLIKSSSLENNGYYTNGCSLFAITSEDVRRKRALDFTSFAELLEHISSSKTLETTLENIEKQSSSNLFLSANYIERVGGIGAVLHDKDIYVGNTPIAEFSNIWVFGELYSSIRKNVINPNVTVFYVPTVMSINNAHYVIDINPVFVSSLQVSNPKQLRVPRLFLSIRKAPLWPILHDGENCAFIMSNYNKADYIAAALFSIYLQQYKNISITFVDDNSSDDSIEIASRMKAKLVDQSIEFTIRRNSKNRGTYWIRNSAINHCISRGSLYFVNDSDDFSSSFRSAIQATTIKNSDSAEEIHINFGDIVRVTSNFEILPLDLKVERYGTASLSAKASIHTIVGYYENIMKNADTEFIERLRHFCGKSSAKWFRYPVLWQPFDGKNLTNDIYKQDRGGQLAQKLTKRDTHRELFVKAHSSLAKEELYKVYSFPNFKYSEEYKDKLADFLIKDIQ